MTQRDEWVQFRFKPRFKHFLTLSQLFSTAHTHFQNFAYFFSKLYTQQIQELHTQHAKRLTYLLQNEALHSKYHKHISNTFAIILIPDRFVLHRELCVVLWNFTKSDSWSGFADLVCWPLSETVTRNDSVCTQLRETVNMYCIDVAHISMFLRAHAVFVLQSDEVLRCWGNEVCVLMLQKLLLKRLGVVSSHTLSQRFLLLRVCSEICLRADVMANHWPSHWPKLWSSSVCSSEVSSAQHSWVYLIKNTVKIVKYYGNLRQHVWISVKLWFISVYFQHHYCSLQSHMIFRNHNNILLKKHLWLLSMLKTVVLHNIFVETDTF